MQALEMKKHLWGEDHPDVGVTLNHLGRLYESQQRYKEAESLLAQALELNKRSLGD
jgi:tetratricopeptide (TPR) repeat protein